MSRKESESGEPEGTPPELATVAERLSELQRRKRATVRWHMSRETAERAIAAITDTLHSRAAAGSKSRRRKRHKRLL